METKLFAAAVTVSSRFRTWNKRWQSFHRFSLYYSLLYSSALWYERISLCIVELFGLELGRFVSILTLGVVLCSLSDNIGSRAVSWLWYLTTFTSYNLLSRFTRLASSDSVGLFIEHLFLFLHRHIQYCKTFCLVGVFLYFASDIVKLAKKSYLPDPYPAL